MHGCIESGSSVSALTYDDHRGENDNPFLLERAVEAMLGSNTMAFMNEALMARSVQLRLTKVDAKEGPKEDKKDEKKDDKKDDEKEEKKKGKKSQNTEE